MGSIAQTLNRALCFVFAHLGCISITATMAIWAAFNAWRHKRIDGKILRTIRTNPPLSAEQIAQLLQRKTSRIESRLWDLEDRGKVIVNTATGVRLWTTQKFAGTKRG